jgi:hypothetical protein
MCHRLRASGNEHISCHRRLRLLPGVSVTHTNTGVHRLISNMMNHPLHRCNSPDMPAHPPRVTKGMSVQNQGAMLGCRGLLFPLAGCEPGPKHCRMSQLFLGVGCPGSLLGVLSHPPSRTCLSIFAGGCSQP